MAVLIGFDAFTGQVKGATAISGNISPDIVFGSVYPYQSNYPNILGKNWLYGEVTDNAPVSLNSRTITGFLAKYYLYDFYFRIRIIPSVMDLGLILTAQIRTIEVWNTDFSNKTLLSISPVNTTGLTLSEQITPAIYKPLQSEIYNVSVSVDGPANIKAAYVFNFLTISLAVTITGTRIVMWPFPPDISFTEVREWFTDIITAGSTEQRFALRDRARTVYQYNYRLDNSQAFSAAKSLAAAFSSSGLATPVWEEVTQVFSITAGTKVININTENLELAVGDIIALWKNYDEFETAEIAEIQADKIITRLELNNSFISCWFIPVKLAFTSAGVTFVRRPGSLATASIEFLSLNTFHSAEWFNSESFLGYKILSDKTVIKDSLQEKISRKVNIFDSETGNLVVTDKETYSRHEQVISFAAHTREQRYKIRRAFDYLFGSHTAFWLPSFNKDIIPVNSSLSADSPTLLIRYIGWSVCGWKNIRIIGSNTVNLQVTNVTDNNNGTETLHFASGPAEEITNITHIFALTLVRLAGDRVEFTNVSSNLMYVNVPVVEVQE